MEGNGALYVTISFISYLFILFGVTVILEIFILHFWGLDTNTTKSITERPRKDDRDFEDTIAGEIFNIQNDSDDEDDEKAKAKIQKFESLNVQMKIVTF